MKRCRGVVTFAQVMKSGRSIACLAIAALAGSCGGDGVESAAASAQQPQPAAVNDGQTDPLDADAAMRRLESIIATPRSSGNHFESWVCLEADVRTDYRLYPVDAGRRDGQATAADGTSSRFEWVVAAIDTVAFDFPISGQRVELASIRFDGPNAFRASIGTGRTLDCRRQIYIDGLPTRDTSGAEPIDTDRESAEALALEQRIATSYRGPARYDYWYCAFDDGEPTAYLLSSMGAMATRSRAVVLPGGISATLDPARPIYGWRAIDGTSVILTPENADGQPRGGLADIIALREIVFPLDDAFTAVRQDGAMLQCLRQTHPV